MNTPKVTVLLAVFNGELFIRESIESILKQTFSNFEFLIIDDCSNDCSIDIINSYQDNRIRLIRNENNIGQTKSLNKGLKLAKGEYLARMDHDDISLPNRLRIQVEYLDNNPDISLISSLTKNIDSHGNILNTISRINSSEEIFYYMYFLNPITHPSVMFRTKKILEFGGYDNDTSQLMQDYELWSRINHKVKMYKIQDVLLYYRIYENQLSSKYVEKQFLLARDIFFRQLREIGVDESLFDECKYYFESSFKNDFKNISLKKLKLLKKINSLILNNCPSFLDKQKVKRTADFVFLYYISVFLRKFKIFNPLFDFILKNS